MNTNAIKPRIKQWVDVYNSINHKINEVNIYYYFINLILSYFIQKDEYMNYEANDPFMLNFIRNIGNLLSQLKENLTSNNYDTLVGVVTLEIVNTIEKSVLKCSFSKVSSKLFSNGDLF